MVIDLWKEKYCRRSYKEWPLDELTDSLAAHAKSERVRQYKISSLTISGEQFEIGQVVILRVETEHLEGESLLRYVHDCRYFHVERSKLTELCGDDLGAVIGQLQPFFSDEALLNLMDPAAQYVRTESVLDGGKIIHFLKNGNEGTFRIY